MYNDLHRNVFDREKRKKKRTEHKCETIVIWHVGRDTLLNKQRDEIDLIATNIIKNAYSTRQNSEATQKKRSGRKKNIINADYNVGKQRRIKDI